MAESEAPGKEELCEMIEEINETQVEEEEVLSNRAYYYECDTGKTALLSKKSRKSEGNARKVESISFTLVQRCVNMTKAISYGNCIRTRSSGDRAPPSGGGSGGSNPPGCVLFLLFSIAMCS